MKLDQRLESALKELRKGNRILRRLETAKKNQTLEQLARQLDHETANILSANQEDLERLADSALPSFRDRLTLNPQRIAGMAESLRQVARLADPVGETLDEKRLANGLRLKRVRAPLGTIFLIFESRPNVILEAFSLAFKSGNAMVQRGGSDSRATSRVIYRMIAEVLAKENLGHVFYGIEDYDRLIVEALLKRKDLVDVVVPRGGEKLIEMVQSTALMPIIKNDRGLCHTFVDESADLKMALAIVVNAKTQRPGVCNSLETVLVHQNCAKVFIPQLYQATQDIGLRWRVDQESFALLQGQDRVELAGTEAWDTEYLDLVINCRVVERLEQAISHIERHGSRHSEAIVTKSEENARLFQEEVDAAAVYWNASTRFTDGFEFGLGGELGISTQKLHVRGPVGLRELTTPRWIIDGTGQVR